MKSPLVLLLIAISSLCLAQNKPKKPLSAEAYNKKEQKARKSLADKDPVKQLIGKWQLAELFADKNAIQYNADSTWHYIAAIDAPFNKIKSEIREQAEKKADLSASAFKKAKITLLIPTACSNHLSSLFYNLRHDYSEIR